MATFFKHYLLTTGGIGAIVGASKTNLYMTKRNELGYEVPAESMLMKCGSGLVGAYIGAVMGPVFPLVYAFKRVIDVSMDNKNMTYSIHTRFPDTEEIADYGFTRYPNGLLSLASSNPTDQHQPNQNIA